MFLGKLLGIRNFMFLFQLSITGEEILFLTGMFLLSRIMFRNKSTYFLVGLSSIALILNPTFESNLTWLRFISWLPLVLYFIVQFFTHEAPEYLWLGGITSVFWSMGNSARQPMWILALGTIFIIMLIKKPSIWRCFFNKRWTNWTVLGCIFPFWRNHTPPGFLCEYQHYVLALRA